MTLESRFKLFAPILSADITADAKAFTATIRNRVFAFLRALSIGDHEPALESLADTAQPDGEPWTSDRLQAVIEEYYDAHEQLCLDPNARNLRHTYVIPSEDKRHWRVQQMLIDPDEQNDWVAEFEVDLAQSRADGQPIVRLRRIGSLT